MHALKREYLDDYVASEAQRKLAAFCEACGDERVDGRCPQCDYETTLPRYTEGAPFCDQCGIDLVDGQCPLYDYDTMLPRFPRKGDAP